MAQLAIKGHATRGKEVIEILEMLGGANKYLHCGESESYFFFIQDGLIDCDEVKYTDDYVIYTLEEFIEKFPYKVGDKVKVCGDNLGVIIGMRWESGYVVYKVKLSKNGYETSKISENLQPYEETPTYLNRKVNKQAEEIKEILEPVKEIMEEIKLDIPDGYEFFGIDDDNKIVLTKKQPPYPKTYKECCKILNWNHRDYDRVGYNSELLCKLQVLLLCRDAYWKIAGEQRGLGKPWEPQFENCSIPHYCIFINNTGEIYNDCFYGSRCLLAFPTKEMRDAFYENFKELIEQCKELL